MGGGFCPLGGGGGALLHSIAAHCNAVCNRQHSAVRFFRGVGREQTATPPNKYIPLPPPQCCVAQSWGQEGGAHRRGCRLPPPPWAPSCPLPPLCAQRGGGAGGVSAAVATTVQSSDSDSPFFGHLVVFFKGGVSFFFLFFGGGVVVVCLCDCWGRVWGGGVIKYRKINYGGFFWHRGGASGSRPASALGSHAHCHAGRVAVALEGV